MPKNTRASLPQSKLRFIPPMLATPIRTLPEGPSWQYEEENTASARALLDVKKSVRYAFATLVVLLSWSLSPGCEMARAAPIRVRYREGESQGFLVLRTTEGKVLAAGDQRELVRGDTVIVDLEFHFGDGSLYEEKTVFSQRRAFRLLSDYLLERGPAFPQPLEVSIDAIHGRVTVHSTQKGKETVSTEQVKIPADIANGLMSVVLKNLPPDAAQTTVSYLTPTAKPRLAKLVIFSSGKDPFSVVGSRRRAIHYVLKLDLQGIAGVVAPLLGKQPANMHVWIFDGSAPAFLRFEGALYDGGPTWLIELAAPVWPHAAAETRVRLSSSEKIIDWILYGLQDAVSQPSGSMATNSSLFDYRVPGSAHSSLTQIGQIVAQLGITKRRFKQVDSICLIREQRASGCQELAFNARPFVLCGLPLRRPPSTQVIHRRRNGKFFLHVVAHPDFGLPTVRADCTCSQFAFWMGGNISSLPPAARWAI